MKTLKQGKNSSGLSNIPKLIKNYEIHKNLKSRESVTKFMDDYIYMLRDKWERKNQEYSSDINCFDSSIKAGLGRGISPEDALIGMVNKHWVSLSDLSQQTTQGLLTPTIIWDEKISDMIIYMLLLASLIRRERKHEPLY